jgi:hypothetical protein
MEESHLDIMNKIKLLEEKTDQLERQQKVY